jgi:hypothetical protein
MERLFGALREARQEARTRRIEVPAMRTAILTVPFGIENSEEAPCCTAWIMGPNVSQSVPAITLAVKSKRQARILTSRERFSRYVVPAARPCSSVIRVAAVPK